MKRLFFGLLCVCMIHKCFATEDAHQLSYRGIKPYTSGGSTSGPYTDGDGKKYYCDAWRVMSDHILLIGYRYVDPAYYWRDQKYVLAIDPSGMENHEDFGVNAGLVTEFGVMTGGTWGSITHKFTGDGNGSTMAGWDHGYNADPAVYAPPQFDLPPYGGEAPGVWTIGLVGYRSNFTVRTKYVYQCFWPEHNATAAGNVFKSGSKPNDPGGSGTDGTDDPNGPGGGSGGGGTDMGPLLGHSWWPDLITFLFIPTKEDTDILIASFSQFQNWGPFKMIADIAGAFGDMAGGSMGDLTTDYHMPIPAFNTWGGSETVNLYIDLSPYATWIVIARAIMLGFFMIKLGNWWIPKFQAILTRS